MKYFKILLILLLLSAIIACNDKSELEITEIEFKEKYSLSGYVNGVYTELHKSTETQGITQSVSDSVEIIKGISFNTYSDNTIEIQIYRDVLVPKSKLVNSNELLNDSIEKYIPQFNNFNDFANLFQPGEYDYNFTKDETYTVVITGKENMKFYFSDYQPKSSFTFIIDTLLTNEEEEMIYISGEFNSVNSSNNPEIKDMIELTDMKFSLCLKNIYNWPPED